LESGGHDVFDVDSKNHSETSAERVLRLMRFGKDQCIEVLCQTQTEHSDGSLRSDGSRGEGNRPRLIYAIREVQELMLEIIGKCGLNLFDEDGNRLINEKTGQPLQNLQKGWPEEARDLIEELCTKKLSHRKVVQVVMEAASGAHFLEVEAARQACLNLAERLLRHLDALKQVRASSRARLCWL
jgi:hypothetical protein